MVNLEVLDLYINIDLEILKEIDKIKQFPNLKILKIVDVNLDGVDIDTLKKSLRPDIEIILTIPEYFQSLK